MPYHFEGREYTASKFHDLLIANHQTIEWKDCRKSFKKEYPLSDILYCKVQPKVIYKKYNTVYAVIMPFPLELIPYTSLSVDTPHL